MGNKMVEEKGSSISYASAALMSSSATSTAICASAFASSVDADDSMDCASLKAWEEELDVQVQ